MKRIHQDDEVREGFMLDLDEIAREGARRMLVRALQALRLLLSSFGDDGGLRI
jgi:hypothetical protein